MLGLIVFLGVAGPLTVFAGPRGPVPSAPAQANTAAREFVLEGNVGAFEVIVSPAYVTVFYLPEPVTKALASDQRNFSISIMGDTVALRPLTNGKASTANLAIETASLRLSIILKVGSAEEAVSQVVFTRAEDKATFERRVNESTPPRGRLRWRRRTSSR